MARVSGGVRVWIWGWVWVKLSLGCSRGPHWAWHSLERLSLEWGRVRGGVRGGMRGRARGLVGVGLDVAL